MGIFILLTSPPPSQHKKSKKRKKKKFHKNRKWNPVSMMLIRENKENSKPHPLQIFDELTSKTTICIR